MVERRYLETHMIKGGRNRAVRNSCLFISVSLSKGWNGRTKVYPFSKVRDQLHLCWLWYKLILTILKSLLGWNVHNMSKEFMSWFNHPYHLRVSSNGESSFLRHRDSVPRLSLAALEYLRALAMFLWSAFSQDEVSRMVENNLVCSCVERQLAS